MNLRHLALALLVSLAVCLPRSTDSAFFHKGGLPASTPLTVSTLNLSNTTFVGGSPSGTVVGQLSVLLSFGPFLGTYSIQTTGTDHAGTPCTTAGNNFAPSAGSLVTSGIVPIGSYAGVCVAAAQPGATNSPFVQAFTIVGQPPPQAVFDNGGTPWSFTSLVSAINYNTGGQGVAYNATQRTGAGCDISGATYRSDWINFKTASWPAQPSVPYRLCGSLTAGDFHNYYITVAETGSHTITLYTANANAGAVWTIEIDGISVTTMTLPGNGGGDFTTILPATSSSFNIATTGQHTLTIVATSGDPTGNYVGDFAGWQGNVAGASIACDQGPNAPALSNYPVDVTTSTLTHCALNADFTSISMDSNGIKYSDISTWVRECGGANHTYDFHISYWVNTTIDAQGKTACPTVLGGNNDLSITSDPLGGGFNVLHVVYTLNDQNNFISACGSDQCHTSNFRYDNLDLNWPALLQNSPGLPYEMYKETTVYIPTTALNSGVSGHSPRLAPSSSDISSAGIAGNFIASDQFEINPSGGFDSGQTSWSWNVGFGVETSPNVTPCCSPVTFPNFNFASGYHVIGQLITSDENNNISQCIYIDGNIQTPVGGGGPCVALAVSSSGAPACSSGGFACYFGKNSKVLQAFVPIAESCFPFLYQQNPVGACMHNNVDVYYKSLRVFTCSTYKTVAGCPGPIITASNAAKARRYANSNTPEGLIKQAISWLLGRAA